MKKYLIIILLFNGLLIKCNDKKYSNLIETYKKQIDLCEKLKNKKDVSVCKNKIILNLAKQKNDINTEKIIKSDSETGEVLSQFANIVLHFGTIISNPKNPKSIGIAVINMVASLIKIFASLTKQSAKMQDHKNESVTIADNQQKVIPN